MDYYIALNYITLQYITLQYISVQYITLHSADTFEAYKATYKKEDSTARHYKVWGKAARQIQEDK